MKVVERFLKYVSIDTQSELGSKNTPSTYKQLDLANVLVEEMLAMGIADAHVDPSGIVYGSIPSNTSKTCDTIGFIAHMDTSFDMSGENVKPRIIKQYDGEEIVLNEALKISMDTHKFPSLLKHIGQDLIVTDGTTLLGADDKAGISEILTMCEYFLTSNEEHGTIKIAFTPDEEIGRGTENFNVEKFGADYAYTVDGGDIECIDYENFHAASAHVEVQGNSIHPGEAKYKMINASEAAMHFHTLLPIKDRPYLTEGYEGFNHLVTMQGTCEFATMDYIIRNHDIDLFEQQKEEFRRVANFLNQRYPHEVIQVRIVDSYANMADKIKKRMDIVEKVEVAMREIGLQPKHSPIRGGTDGARLTYMGLLCPNIGTGGNNFHGKYEYISIQSMKKIVELLIKVVKNNAA